jgi:dipeptidase D
MGHVLGHLKPELVWNHFEEICKYPRPSKFEEKIAAYVESVGKRNNLKTIRDTFGNVIIYKPATPGKENLKTVVLQGHIDMVCEKNRGVEHDFDNDPIDVFVDGEWVKARGTTLGADNGIGVAAALAVVEDATLQHGPLEFLFTLDEETGLTGAANLDTTVLKADILLNLDSEEEGTLYIGCSGGKNTEAHFAFTQDAVPAGSVAFEIKVAGLIGGHSGLEIHTGLGNALKILNRLLWTAQKKFDVRVAKFEGGNKHNAIPREAFAVVTVPGAQASAFAAFVSEYNTVVKKENATKEPGLKVVAEDHALPSFVIDAQTQQNLLNTLFAVPHGVLKMSADIPGLVETSTNLATMTMTDTEVYVVTSQRSSVASENEEAVEMVTAAFLLGGARVEYGDGYPGWTPNVHSEILGRFKTAYHDLFGKEPEVKAIHAGLECGIISEKYPNMDMISFGPTMFGVHSPDERLLIPSVAPFYQLLTSVLANIPAK